MVKKLSRNGFGGHAEGASGVHFANPLHSQDDESAEDSGEASAGAQDLEVERTLNALVLVGEYDAEGLAGQEQVGDVIRFENPASPREQPSSSSKARASWKKAGSKVHLEVAAEKPQTFASLVANVAPATGQFFVSSVLKRLNQRPFSVVDDDFKDGRVDQDPEAVGQDYANDAQLTALLQVFGSHAHCDDTEAVDDEMDEDKYLMWRLRKIKGTSLCIFSEDNKFRLAVHNLISHGAFECFILLCILLLTATLIADSPGNRLTDHQLAISRRIDFGVTIVFTIEALLRIIQCGFVHGKHTYLHKGWNQLDFVIVITLWGEIIAQQYAISHVTELTDVASSDAFAGGTLRTLRILHALRFFTGVKVIMRALSHAADQIRTVMLLLFLMFLTFGTICIPLFEGVIDTQCYTRDSDAAAPSVRTIAGFNGTFENGTIENLSIHASFATNRSNNVSVSHASYAANRSNNQSMHDTALRNASLVAAMLNVSHGLLALEQSSSSSSSWGSWDNSGPADRPSSGARVRIACPASMEYACPGSLDSLKCEARVNTYDVGHDRHEAIHMFGFNNILYAFLTQFIVMTLDEWPVITRLVDSNNASTAWLIWPCFAMMVVLLFLVGTNLFVAAVTYAFMYVREDEKAIELMRLRHDIRTKSKANLLALDAGHAAVDEILRAENLLDDVQFEGADELEGDGELAALSAVRNHPQSFPWIPGISPVCRKIVLQRWFDNFMLLVILLNVGVMASYHHDMSENLARITAVSYYAFTTIYVLECLLKICGVGISPYLSYSLNVLDFVVVLLSLAALFHASLATSSVGRFLKLLIRLARILRVFRLAAKAESIVYVLRALLSSWTSMLNVCAFVGFCIVVFSVVSMHTLGQCHLPAAHVGLKEDLRIEEIVNITKTLPRTNFFTFYHSLLANFQILTGEDWVPIMFDYMQLCGKHVALYFVLLFITYKYIVFNLFVALILEYFIIPENKKLERQEEEYKKKARVDTNEEELRAMQWLTGAYATGEDQKSLQKSVSKLVLQQRKLEQKASQMMDGLLARAGKSMRRLAGRTTEADMAADAEDDTHTLTPRGREEKAQARKAAPNIVCCCLSSENCLRKACVRLTESEAFHSTMAIAVVANCICLSLESPTRKPIELATLFYIDYTFFVIFWMESCLLAVAKGLIGNHKAYLRNKMNCMDMAINIACSVVMVRRHRADFTAQSFVTMSPGDVRTMMTDDVTWVRVCRTLRVLRVIRLTKHFDGMKPIIAALTESASMIASTLLITGVIVIMFGVVGIHLFSGKYGICDGAETLAKIECNRTMAGEDVEWKNPPFDFDNIFNALHALFIASTTEGWVTIMNAGVDSPLEVGGAPVAENKPWAVAYFVAFMVLAPFFATNLFIGVLVNYFTEHSGTALLTRKQKQWCHAKLLCIQVEKPVPRKPDEDSWRIHLWHVCESRTFKYATGFVIIANAAVISIQQYPRILWLGIAAHWVNLAFLMLMTVEIFIRSLAYGKDSYLASRWNQLDLFVVLFAWIAIVIQSGSLGTGVQFIEAECFNAFRVMRLFSLVKDYEMMDTMFATLRLSAASVFNLALLSAIVYFVYGTVGMHLYAGLPHTEGGYLNDLENFDTTPEAMRLLFEIGTGHEFYGLMDEMQQGGAMYVVVYFFSFYTVSVFMLTNIFVAVVLENFEMNFTTSHDEENQECGLAEVTELRELFIERTDWPHTSCSVQQGLDMLFELEDEHPLADVRKIDYWRNRLVVELFDESSLSLRKDQLDASFQNFFMSLLVLHLSADCLPYALQRRRLLQLFTAQQRVATRIIACHVRLRRYLTTKPREWDGTSGQWARKLGRAPYGYDIDDPKIITKIHAVAKVSYHLSIALIVKNNKLFGAKKMQVGMKASAE